MFLQSSRNPGEQTYCPPNALVITIAIVHGSTISGRRINRSVIFQNEGFTDETTRRLHSPGPHVKSDNTVHNSIVMRFVMPDA